MKSIEYLVLVMDDQYGPLKNVRAPKLSKTWPRLQEALDELGLEGWKFQTCLYGPTTAREHQGDHYCEAIIFERSTKKPK